MVWTPDVKLPSYPGWARVSPTFGTEPELVGWLRQRRRDGDEVAAWKRTVWGSDFVDERLSTRDEPAADPKRLAAIWRELAEMLDRKKRELDKYTKKGHAA
jgi:hypothetical protein